MHQIVHHVPYPGPVRKFEAALHNHLVGGNLLVEDTLLVGDSHLVAVVGDYRHGRGTCPT